MADKVVTLTALVPEHLAVEIEAALREVFSRRPSIAAEIETKAAPRALKISLDELAAMELPDVLVLVRREGAGELKVEIDGFDEDEFRAAFEEAAEDWLDPANGHDVLNDGFTPFDERSDLEVYAYLRQYLPDADCLTASAPAP